MPTLDNTLNANSNAVTNLAAPSNANDAATKAYVDASRAGLNAKISAKAASMGNLTLSAPQTVDGVSLVAGDRVLVKNQSTASANGIYLVAAGAWTRTPDTDVWAELVSAFTFVEQGTTQADTSWLSTADQGGTLGTTAVAWAQFGSAAAYTAGNGLTLTGNQFAVVVDGTTVEINTNAVRVKDGGIDAGKLATGAVNLTTTTVTGALPPTKGGTGQTTVKSARETGLAAAGIYTATGPASPSTTFAIPQSTHQLRQSMGLVVFVFDTATGEQLWPTLFINSGGDVTLSSSVAKSANAWTVVVQG